MIPEPAKPTRRDFRLPFSLGAAVAVLGLGVTALFRTGLASETAPQSLTFDLTSLAEGHEIILAFERRPILIRHRSAKDIARAEADDATDFPDPLAQNANLPASAPALDTNRRATPDGRFLVMEAVTPSDPCVATWRQGGRLSRLVHPLQGSAFRRFGPPAKRPLWNQPRHPTPRSSKAPPSPFCPREHPGPASWTA